MDKQDIGILLAIAAFIISAIFYAVPSGSQQTDRAAPGVTVTTKIVLERAP